MNKWHFIYGLLLAVLTGVIFYLIFGVGKNNIVEQERLRAQISALEGQIETYEGEVSRMHENIRSKDQVIDSLKGDLENTAENLERNKKSLRNYAKRFKELTDRDRDSLLYAYIRANQ